MYTTRQVACRCPVCNGRGTVPADFYTRSEVTSNGTLTGEVQCRSCHGSGIVWTASWEYEPDPVQPFIVGDGPLYPTVVSTSDPSITISAQLAPAPSVVVGPCARPWKHPDTAWQYN